MVENDNLHIRFPVGAAGGEEVTGGGGEEEEAAYSRTSHRSGGDSAAKVKTPDKRKTDSDKMKELVVTLVSVCSSAVTQNGLPSDQESPRVSTLCFYSEDATDVSNTTHLVSLG